MKTKTNRKILKRKQTKKNIKCGGFLGFGNRKAKKEAKVLFDEIMSTIEKLLPKITIFHKSLVSINIYKPYLPYLPNESNDIKDPNQLRISKEEIERDIERYKTLTFNTLNEENYNITIGSQLKFLDSKNMAIYIKSKKKMDTKIKQFEEDKEHNYENALKKLEAEAKYEENNNNHNNNHNNNNLEWEYPEWGENDESYQPILDVEEGFKITRNIIDKIEKDIKNNTIFISPDRNYSTFKIIKIFNDGAGEENYIIKEYKDGKFLKDKYNVNGYDKLSTQFELCEKIKTPPTVPLRKPGLTIGNNPYGPAGSGGYKKTKKNMKSRKSRRTRK